MSSADRVSQRVPLCHFPGSVALRSPHGGWTAWKALRPPRDRGVAPPAGRFDHIVWDHVFLYAGPPCFALRPDAVGDSVLYFDGALDGEIEGRAAPFDTGACRPGGHLQPFASADDATCQHAIDRASAPITSWRSALRHWLDRCYDAPGRYLETSDEPYADGEPERTEPAELLEHNGRRGIARGYARCADRRAWTWEIRSMRSVGFVHLRALHVMPSSYRRARRNATELALAHGRRRKIAVIVVRDRAPSGPRALYRDATRALSILMNEDDR